jgi:phosphoribulokinase
MIYSDFKDVITKSPFIFTIGVAGDSGSGKTTFTHAIREIFGGDLVSTISLDDYHTLDRLERKRKGITPLDPNANNLELLTQHIRDLKAGLDIKKPVYNHIRGTIEPPIRFSPTKIIILEGLHTLFTPDLRKQIDFSLFVDPETEVKVSWKIKRDMGRRGYQKAEVLKEIGERKSDYDRYIAPQWKYADTVISISHSKWGADLGGTGNIYNVTLFQEKLERSIKDVELSIDLFAILSLSDRNFLLEFRREEINGREMGALTFDGELQYDVIRKLERNVEKQTGIHPISIFSGRDYVTATDIIQLILSWRIIHRRIFIEYGDDEITD